MLYEVITAVSLLVPEIVVDPLEVVDIHYDAREASADSAGHFDISGKIPGKLPPVGKPREVVV